MMQKSMHLVIQELQNLKFQNNMMQSILLNLWKSKNILLTMRKHKKNLVLTTQTDKENLVLIIQITKESMILNRKIQCAVS